MVVGEGQGPESKGQEEKHWGGQLEKGDSWGGGGGDRALIDKLGWWRGQVALGAGWSGTWAPVQPCH